MAIQISQPSVAITSAAQTSDTVFGEYTRWISGGTNVVYKIFVFIALLIILSLIPATQKLAGWVAGIILLLCLIGRNG